MTDIVERLRLRRSSAILPSAYHTATPDRALCIEAADEIERLRAVLALLLDFHNEGRIPTREALAQAEAALGDKP